MQLYPLQVWIHVVQVPAKGLTPQPLSQLLAIRETAKAHRGTTLPATAITQVMHVVNIKVGH